MFVDAIAGMMEFEFLRVLDVKVIDVKGHRCIVSIYNAV